MPNAYVFDWDALSGAIGRVRINDDLIGFYSHMALWDAELYNSYEFHPQHKRIEPAPRLDETYPSEIDSAIMCLWRQVDHMYRTVNQIDVVKLVIFDLDDTMWRGQLAEHYLDDGSMRPSLDGWPTGIWEAIHHLRSRGILVAICSKNDKAFIEENWNRAVLSNWINISDFSFVEIGWEPKAKRIKSIIDTAGLTPRSVVFVDDNPVERASVKAELPDIRVIGRDPNATRRILLWSSETQRAILSAESLQREDSMRAMQKRSEASQKKSREEFLQELDCKIKIISLDKMTHSDFARSFELINKTNQFNTTGRRWSSLEVQGFFDEGGHFMVWSVEDKFTNYGLVGVLMVRGDFILQMVMSCRVLGLDIEIAILSDLLEQSSGGVMTATMLETASNKVCRDVFHRSNFEQDSERPNFWIFRSQKNAIKRVGHVKILQGEEV